MTDSEREASAEGDEVRATDIVFDCPYCTKSLAIDYRGAGLTIQCTDCGNNVIVPIPEGLDLSDIDGTEEEQEIRMVNLRRLLTAAEERVGQLEVKVAEAIASHEALQSLHAGTEERFQRVLGAVRDIQNAQDDINKAIKAISDVARSG
jgi:hypothetical protein